MKIAKCYGVWGWKYYRTDEGETYSIKPEVCGGKTTDKLTVFYYGNTKTGKYELRILTEEEYKQIQFVD